MIWNNMWSSSGLNPETKRKIKSRTQSRHRVILIESDLQVKLRVLLALPNRYLSPATKCQGKSRTQSRHRVILIESDWPVKLRALLALSNRCLSPETKCQIKSQTQSRHRVILIESDLPIKLQVLLVLSNQNPKSENSAIPVESNVHSVPDSSSGVNFITILCLPFLSESILRTFSLITVYSLALKFFLRKNIGTKTAHKMLMKLTTGGRTS